MVQRKRLALIFITLCLSFALFAETAEAGYQSSEPDSLIIFDAEGVAEPLVELSGEIVEAQDAHAEWFESIDRDYSYAFMDAEKNRGTGSDLWQKHTLLSGVYTAHHNYFGFEPDLPTLKKGKMILPASLASRYLYLGYFSHFHHLEEHGGELSFAAKVYDNPVSLSYLQGSMGEYDNKLMTFGFYKGDLFGLPSLSLMANYMLQNGEWMENGIDSNALRLLLNYKVAGGELRYEHGSFKKDFSKYELQTLFWHLQNQRFENRLSYDHLEYYHPYLHLEAFRSREHSSAKGSSIKRKEKVLAFAAESSYDYGFGEVGLRYEYRDSARNFIAAPDKLSPDYENLYQLDFSWDKFIRFEGSFRHYDFKLPRLNWGLGIPIGRFALGVKEDRFFSTRDPVTQISHPTQDVLIPAIDIITEHNRLFYLAYESAAIKASAGVGGKTEKNYAPGGDEYAMPITIIEADVSFDKRYGDWQPKARWHWQHARSMKAMPYEPDYRFAITGALKRHLGHDNALTVGMNLATHTGYHLINAVNHYSADASSVIDLFLNVDISRNFELHVEAKNLLSASYHGLIPMPFSLHAGLRWYFLN